MKPRTTILSKIQVRLSRPALVWITVPLDKLYNMSIRLLGKKYCLSTGVTELVSCKPGDAVATFATLERRKSVQKKGGRRDGKQVERGVNDSRRGIDG